MPEKENPSEKLLNNIFASLEGGIFAIDRNGRIIAVNRAAEEITGYKMEEMVGHECGNYLRSDICKDKCPLTKTLASGKTVSHYEIMITNKSGVKIPVNITTSPLRSSNNEITGVVQNFRDLTKHIGLWGKLRQEKNRAQQYLNIAGVIIVAINNLGEVTLINKKGCDVLGYKEEEIVGKNWFDLCLPQEIKKEVKAVFKRLMAGDNHIVEYYENSILTQSGDERIIAWHNTILMDDRKKIVGTLSSGEDITKRKQTEVELIRSEKLASVGQLAASVAHEVNNPLAGILVYLKLLLKKYGENKLQAEDTERQLLKMEKELLRTSRIIRNLLDFSRQSEPTKKPLEINSVIESALALVKHQISLENIQLKKNLDLKLPPVLADFDQIQQVLINIFQNSTQAMPDGGNMTITTSMVKGILIDGIKKNTVRIDIMDTGIGISKENLDKLFTPFFTTKEKGKGVGLGLSVVHGIIEQHKGKIVVESEPNIGSKFSVYLEVLDEEKTNNSHR